MFGQFFINLIFTNFWSFVRWTCSFTYQNMPNQSANCHCVIASADFVASSRGIGLKQVLRVMDDKMLITTIPGSSLRSLSLSLITMISPNGLITFALSSSFLHFLALCHQAKQQDGSTKLQIQRKPSYYWGGYQLTKWFKAKIWNKFSYPSDLAQFKKSYGHNNSFWPSPEKNFILSIFISASGYSCSS